MPRFPRLVVPGYPHHVTQRGVRRQATFFDDIDYRSYLRLAAELKKDWSVDFWAYCLMPNHIHAVVVPKDDDCLSKFFAILHRRYAWRANRRHDWLGHLWHTLCHNKISGYQAPCQNLRSLAKAARLPARNRACFAFCRDRCLKAASATSNLPKNANAQNNFDSTKDVITMCMCSTKWMTPIHIYYCRHLSSFKPTHQQDLLLT